jgi:spore photoproduct lyase
MLNCVYDCRYCFLQGMFRSAHYVVFVNYEDFTDAIEASLEASPSGYFFSGYDCDSLAFEPVTGFAGYFLDFFAGLDSGWLELRSKSTQISSLLARRPFANCIVAFSFTPQEVSAVLEHGVPAVGRRLRAMEQLEERGWRLGLRFDPLIYSDDYRDAYRRLFSEVFSTVSVEALHSVSLGSFRLPRDYFKSVSRHYPEERLFAWGLEERDGMVAYREDLESEMIEFCATEILHHIPRSIYFPCFSS